MGTRDLSVMPIEEERLGGLSHVELGRYEGLVVPLRQAFWDAWEEAVGFYDLANQVILKDDTYPRQTH